MNIADLTCTFAEWAAAPERQIKYLEQLSNRQTIYYADYFSLRGTLIQSVAKFLEECGVFYMIQYPVIEDTTSSPQTFASIEQAKEALVDDAEISIVFSPSNTFLRKASLREESFGEYTVFVQGMSMFCISRTKIDVFDMSYMLH